MAPRVVLVTGASTGIGLELAKKLVNSDDRVVLTARKTSLARFEQEGIYESDNIWFLPLDVVVEAQRKQVIKAIERRWGGVDILINNAGVSYRAVVEHMPEKDEAEQMAINYFGPMRLIRLLLPQLRQKRRGHIINVSSVSGMMAMPTMGSYSASKFALEGATESLWYEMRPWGVHVSLVQPGFVRSKSFERVRLTQESQSSLANESDPYHRYYGYMTPFVEWMMHRAISSAEDVADKILAVMNDKSPKLRIAGTLDARFFYLLRRLIPRSLYHEILFRGLPSIRDWGPRAQIHSLHTHEEPVTELTREDRRYDTR